MKKSLLITLLLAAFLLSPLTPSGASSPIKSILVTPKGFISNLDALHIQVRLNPTTSERYLVLILDCSVKYDEGRVLLGPTEQPPLRVYRNLPGGECTPIAHLFWKDGEKVKEVRMEGPKVYVMTMEPLP